jgi:hypothetical protein
MKVTFWATLLFTVELSLSLLRNNDVSIRILSPLAASVLHTSDCALTILLDPGAGSSGHLMMAVYVNDTELLRVPASSNAASQPTVSLSGLDPGVCSLSVKLLESDTHHTLAQDATTILVSSASLSKDPAEPTTKAAPIGEGDYSWHAVAIGSDDWGRTADMIPVFANMEALQDAEAHGWVPGAWGRATTETAEDLYTCAALSIAHTLYTFLLFHPAEECRHACTTVA